MIMTFAARQESSQSKNDLELWKDFEKCLFQSNWSSLWEWQRVTLKKKQSLLNWSFF